MLQSSNNLLLVTVLTLVLVVCGIVTISPSILQNFSVKEKQCSPDVQLTF